MKLLDRLLHMARRSPRGRTTTLADPRAAIGRQWTAAQRRLGAWKKRSRR